MGWIKCLSLKKSLFTMIFISLVTAALFSALSFWLGVELSTRIFPREAAIFIDGSFTITENITSPAQGENMDVLLIILQIVQPVLFFVTALLTTVFLFYRWKLREPLKVLMEGAGHIIENDLNFSIEVPSADELGQLCAAFETMRQVLLENNQKLWRQAEERKRLNAAFSHDLRNPVTVLKGSVKMAKQCVQCGTEKTEQLIENLERIETYAGRIERYVEVMSHAGQLEQIQLERVAVTAHNLIHDLESGIRLVMADSDKTLLFSASEVKREVSADKNVLFEIMENLVSNALRFAERTVSVRVSFADEILTLEVMDDGYGFPAGLLQNGVQPFQKGNEEAEHFGMGLYICDLLCRKHGGTLTIRNNEQGASVCANLKIS